MFKIKLNEKDFAFVILIGGRSNRFGTDKGLFEFKEKPLISYQLETLLKFKKDIFLTANSIEQIQRYINKIDYKIITGFILDDYELISGKKIRSPLIGLYSSFKELYKLKFEKIFILACDHPFIQYNVVKLIITNSINFDCCIPRWENGFVEPLFAIYSTRKAYFLSKRNLEKKEFKLDKLLDKEWKINYISIEKTIAAIDKKLLTFINLNKAEDIEKLNYINKQK